MSKFLIRYCSFYSDYSKLDFYGNYIFIFFHRSLICDILFRETALTSKINVFFRLSNTKAAITWETSRCRGSSWRTKSFAGSFLTHFLSGLSQRKPCVMGTASRWPSPWRNSCAFASLKFRKGNLVLLKTFKLAFKNFLSKL